MDLTNKEKRISLPLKEYDSIIKNNTDMEKKLEIVKSNLKGYVIIKIHHTGPFSDSELHILDKDNTLEKYTQILKLESDKRRELEARLAEAETEKEAAYIKLAEHRNRTEHFLRLKDVTMSIKLESLIYRAFYVIDNIKIPFIPRILKWHIKGKIAKDYTEFKKHKEEILEKVDQFRNILNEIKDVRGQ